jgi:uncharacterized protein
MALLMPCGSASGQKPIPAMAGVGLRPVHHSLVLGERPKVAWFEVHAENFMTRGAMRADLEAIAQHYPLSIHAVGLSLGSICLPESGHLGQLRELVEHLHPDLVSDHLSWSAVDSVHFPDLLPLPYTEEALEVVIRNVVHVQDCLGRQLLLENPSTYLEVPQSALTEGEFLAELTLRNAPRAPSVLFQNPSTSNAAMSHSETPRNQLAPRIPNTGYIQEISGPWLM